MTTRIRTLWLPAAILAALAPVLAALGVWQLHRAEAKQVLQQEYDQRSNDVPRRLGPALVSEPEWRFRRVAARGAYDPDYQILIDNRVHHGRPGYYVVTPLRLEGGDTRVLVNRGWVALGASREQLPVVDTPAGVQDISGVATVPMEPTFTLASPPAGERGWQPVWPYLDLPRYAASVPFAVQPVVLLLDADVAYGYARDWARLDAGIALHHGYAFQWFALAVLVLVIAIYMICRNMRRRRESPA